MNAKSDISGNTKKTTQTISYFLESYCAAHKVHTKSLLSTFFGDLAIPYGGKVWVETLVSILDPLGVNSRLVRTSLFRLVDEKWLRATRKGRKSFYQLTKKAYSQTALAEKLLYYADQAEWDGEWTLVFIVLNPVEAEARKQLEQELAWVGFGLVSKHVFAHPTASEKVVAERVKSLGMSHSVVCMRAKNLFDSDIGLNVTDREMAEQCFPTQELQKEYRRFVDIFSSLDINSIASTEASFSIETLTLRLLLIDEYRRIVLRDPHLPKELLPLDWVGHQAYSLCKDIYQTTLDLTDRIYRDQLSKALPCLLEDETHHYTGRFKG